MNANKKLLVTGASGFVAGSILAQAGPEWELHTLSRGRPADARNGVAWHSYDPLAARSLPQLFLDLRPDVVIHAAAMADIDVCQKEPQQARAVNVEFTRHLAELCSQTGSRLVFCSTDTIFDGEHAPYTEEDRPEPVNRYAETKVAAEEIVRELGTQGMIARLSIVMGLPLMGAGNSFLIRMLQSFREGHLVVLPEREVRTPIDVVTMGRALLELAGNDEHGIVHLAGSTSVNRLELARRIAARFGFPETLVVAQAAADPSRAPRPRDVSLVNSKARATLHTPMLELQDALSLILRTDVEMNPGHYEHAKD